LFEEPPAMIPAVTDSVMPIDPAVVQQKNGNIVILSVWINLPNDEMPNGAYNCGRTPSVLIIC